MSIWSAIGHALGLGGDDNPADAANPYLQKIPGTIKPYLDPYMNEGKGDLGTLHDLFNRMLQDPSQFSKMFAKGFQHSPGYQYQVDQATKAINRNAADTGYLGTPSERTQLASTVGNLANQDFSNYMNRQEGLFDKGLGGLQGLESQGFGATNDYANDLIGNLLNQAKLAYAGQENENEEDAGDLGFLGKLIGTFGGALGDAASLGSNLSSAEDWTKPFM